MGIMAPRTLQLEARIRRTGLVIAGTSVGLFLLSIGLILFKWWTR